jgi:hypothetical protein
VPPTGRDTKCGYARKQNMTLFTGWKLTTECKAIGNALAVSAANQAGGEGYRDMRQGPSTEIEAVGRECLSRAANGGGCGLLSLVPVLS